MQASACTVAPPCTTRKRRSTACVSADSLLTAPLPGGGRDGDRHHHWMGEGGGEGGRTQILFKGEVLKGLKRRGEGE